MQQLRQLGVAALFHELRDVVRAAAATRLALDREGRDAEVRGAAAIVKGRGLLIGAPFFVSGSPNRRLRFGLNQPHHHVAA